MIKNKANKIFQGAFLGVSIICVTLIILFCLNLSSLKISKDFLNSLKNTIQTLKPTEELFDDNGGVKLVSKLFPTTTAEVGNQILSFYFHLDFYERYENSDGIITLYNPSGLLYAFESGVVKITNMDAECDEIKIIHDLGTESVFSGKFIFGVVDGQKVEKGQPIGVIISPKLEFYICNNGEIISTLVLVQGELAWKD